MSTVSTVPESHGLQGDDAVETLTEVSLSGLVKRAASRFRHSDGFSFARSLAFQGILTLIPGTIFVVGLAALLGESEVRRAVSTMIEALAPGPAGEIFRTALDQGSETASRGNTLAVIFGGVATLVGGAAGMAQLQRGASRIYGVDDDRPTVKRYAVATSLTLSVGLLMVVAFLTIGIGYAINGYFEEEMARAWSWFRWPLGILALSLGLAILFKVAPNRTQPGVSWLASGSIIAGVLWVAVSIGLALYLNNSGMFGDTYGPLGGIIALALWCQLSAIAILYGIAVAAELELARSDEASRDEVQRTATKEQP